MLIIQELTPDDQGSPARGATAAHGSPGGTAQAADRRHDPLSGEPRTGGTTIATVAREAGLSQGIINLHFQTKERLLTETLRYLADEYRNACTRQRPGRRARPRPG